MRGCFAGIIGSYSGSERGSVRLGALAVGLLILTVGGTAAAFELQSPAFSPGGEIPVKYTCDGRDVSPPLRWTDLPAGTNGLALIGDDPDAPGGTWVHWVLYGMKVTARELPEGVPAQDTAVGIGRQGLNDFKRVGYGGPCPPRGPAHRYFFKLYALDVEPALPPRNTKAALLKAMEGHVLGQAELMGRYQRR
jgi:Raf kinase inhibitor-like YbhB/YbcL family protein